MDPQKEQREAEKRKVRPIAALVLGGLALAVVIVAVVVANLPGQGVVPEPAPSNPATGGTKDDPSSPLDSSESSPRRTASPETASAAPETASTGELLEAMRDAYETRENERLAGLEVRLKDAEDFEMPVALAFYSELILNSTHRRRLETEFETRVSGVIASHLNQVTDESDKRAWFEQIDNLCRDTLQKNNFDEFNGSWGTSSPIESPTLEQQLSHFHRPRLSPDCGAALMLLIASYDALALEAPPSTPLKCADLLEVCLEPIDDRLSYFQIPLCDFLVRLEADQNLPQLRVAAEGAKLPPVKIAALRAIAALEGTDLTEQLFAEWRRMIDEDQVAQLRREIIAFIAQAKDVSECFADIDRFLLMLEADGHTFRVHDALIVGTLSRPIDEDETRAAQEWVVNTLERDISTNRFAAWTSVVAKYFGPEDGSSIERPLTAKFREIFKTTGASPGSAAALAALYCMPAFGSIWHERPDRIWDLLIDVHRSASDKGALDFHRLILQNLFSSTMEFDNWQPEHQRRMQLLEDMTRRALKLESEEMGELQRAWVIIQHENVRSRLYSLTQSDDAAVRDFAEDALIQWETENER